MPSWVPRIVPSVKMILPVSCLMCWLRKGIKGTIITIIYTIPNLLNLAVTLLLGYYAISFSLVIYKSIFKKEAKNYKPIIKRYIKIGIFFLLIEILISLAEVYIIPNILRFL